MSVLPAAQGHAVAVRLRGLVVSVEVELDMLELDLRDRSNLTLADLDHAQLAALLAVPRWEHVPPTTLPEATSALIRKRPDLVEAAPDGSVSRRVGPPLWVEMLTLPVDRWRPGLRKIGRFAPYSARRLLLTRVPPDVDDLRVQAAYWGVGVQVVTPEGAEDLVTPEAFVPQRYTGASWAFAEQTLRAISDSGSAAQFRR